MVIASSLKDGLGRGLRMGWIKRSLQAAVLVAVSASVPEAWSAGNNIQVNNVAAGSATFSQSGSVTTVRTGSRNTIINYQQLSVGSGETLNFIQPSAKSRVLNRIEGTTPSTIDGTISSNGAVFLLNPNGVLFGHGAVISVNSFVAAAGHMSDADFLKGSNHFTDVTGSVVNNGTITAKQEISLVGLTVGNFGQIVTGAGGVVTMASGNDVYLGTVEYTGQSPHILVKISQNTGAVNAGTGVTNAGTISAGQINMGAGDLYAAGIYNSGSLKGAQITMNSGMNTNITSGTIDASSATGHGGKVELLGDKVGIASGGIVDASGKTGGGTILVGGDFHGAGSVPTSSATFVGSGATLKADAGTKGNGGNIVVWSNGVTRYYGDISAKGGSVSGNGGAVEVSSASNLDFNGGGDVSAAHGTMGTILLDPTNIIINVGVGADDAKATGTTVTFAQDSASTYTFGAAAVQGMTGAIDLQASNDISVNASLTFAAGKSIQMQAGGNITIGAAVAITTSSQAIILSAGDPGGSVVAGAKVSLGAGASLVTTGSGGGADITLRGNAIVLNTLSTLTAGTGAVRLFSNAAANNIRLDTTAGAGNFSFGNSGATITGSKLVIGESGVYTGTITSNQTDLSGLTIPLEINTSGTGGLTLINTTASALQVGAAGTITVNTGSGGIVAGAGTSSDLKAASLVLTSTGAMGTAASPILLNRNGGTINVTVTASTPGEIALSSITGANVLITVGAGGISSTGANVTIAANDVLTGTGSISGANVTLSSDGAMNLSSVTTAGNLTASTTSTGNINATGTLAGGNVSLTASGTIGNTAAVSLTTGGTLTLLSGTGKDITANIGEDLLASNLTLPTTGSARTITLTVAGNFTLDANEGIVADIYSLTTTGAGSLKGGAGVLTGKTITLTSANSIGSGEFDVVVAGTLSLSSGSGQAIDVGIGNNFVTGNLTLPSTGTGRLITLVVTGNLSINSNIGRSADDFNISTTTGSSGNISSTASNTLTGGNITLNADDTINAHLAESGNLSLTTNTGNATVVLPSANTLATSTLTLSVPTGKTADITVGTVNVDGNIGVSTEAISFTTTTGGITGSKTITGSAITLVSKTGIGTNVANPINVNTTGALSLTSQGNSNAGDIYILDTAALTITAAGIPATTGTGAQTISLASSNAGGVTVNGNVDLGISSLILSGSTVTVNATKTVKGANITLAGDTVTISGNVTGNTSTTLAPFTAGQAITVTNTEAGFVTVADLAHISTPALTIGGNTTTVGSNTGLITIGAGTAVDLSGDNFTLTLVAPGGVTFANTLTVKSGSTLTFQAPGAITSSGGADIIIGGATGTVVFNNITGNIGAAGSLLNTQVQNLGGATGAGGIFLANSTTGTLTISGAITLTGSTGSIISDASPLIVNAAVSMAGDFTLLAGSLGTPAVGDDLTINASVTSSTNGIINLEAGHSISQTAGNITAGSGNFTAALGNISQSGTGNVVLTTALTASSATGISLAGTNNTIPAASLTNTTSGTIALTTSGDLSLTTLSQTGGGAITLSAGGNVTQTAAISASGANLSVTTTGSGKNIVLTSSNNIGSGTLTLVASGGNVSYTSSGAITVQKINTTGNATLSGTTIGQDGTDTTGIHSGLLTVTSNGAVTLTNGNNSFSSLNETDSSAGSVLAFTTNTAGGLAITGLSQIGGGTANITNTGGNISSTAVLDIQNLNLTAKGGISITNTSNIIQSASATNTVSGDINIVAQGGGIFGLTVTQISNTGGGATFLSDVDGVALNGTIAAGSGLTVSVGSLNGIFSTSATTVITTTGGGAISITADNMNINSASTTTTTGNVVLTAFTPATTITLNGSDGAGVLGLTSTEIGTISAANIIIGSTSQTGVINNNGGSFNLPTNLTLITQGAANLDGLTITSAAGAKLTVNHGTTMTLGTATLSGGLVETGVSGSGAGGNVTLDNGTVTIGAASVTFNSNVLLSGSASLTTNTTGTSFTFQSINGASGGESLTITAGTGTVNFNGGVGTTTAVGAIQVVSSGAITLGGNIVTNGGFVSLASTGAITLSGGNRTIDTTNAGGNVLGNDIQLAAGVTGGANSLTLTAGSLNGNISVTSFTSTGNFTASGKQFTNSGTISANTIAITNARPATINGNLIATGNLTVDGSASAFSTFTDAANALSGANVTIIQSGLISIGGTITSTGNVTLTSTGSSISATGNVSGAGTIAYSALTTVTTGNITDSSGPFTSNGVNFVNNGNISAVGISITNTGSDTINGTLAAGTGNLSVTGDTSLTDNVSLLSGANVTLSSSGLLNISAPITSLGNVTLTSTGSSVSAIGTIGAAGTVQVSALTTVSVGTVNDTGGPFTSSGTDFTGSNIITAVGITINNTGVISLAGAAAGTGNLSVTGGTSISDPGAALSGGNVTLSASGTVSVGGTITSLQNVTVTSTGANISTTGLVTAAGLIQYTASTGVATGNITDTTGAFTSAGTTFSNAGDISAVGITISNTGADTINGKLIAGTGNLSVTGGTSITDAGSNLSGGNVTLSASGIVSVGGLITATNNVGVTSTAASISTTGNVSGSGTITYSAATTVAVGNVTSTGGLFTSGGTDFTNSGNISAVGITINNTGIDTFNGTLAAGSGNLLVTGAGSITDASSNLSGGNVTLSASGIVSVGGLITATNNVGVTSTAASISTTGNVSGSGTITYSAATTVAVGNVTSTGGLFTSGGTDFTNSGNISAVGITINNTGIDTFNGALAANSGNLLVTGAGSITDASSNLSGGNVTLSSSGAISVGGLITSVANVTITSTGSSISTTGNVSGAGTIAYSALTTVATGNVTDTSGPFTSAGTGFTNSGNISAVGITINNTGLSTFNGTLAAGTGNLTVTNASGITDTSSNLSGGNISLTASGVISIGGNLTATNGIIVHSTGSSISTTGNVSGSTAITYTAASGVTVGNVTSTGGLFTSGGTTFLNSGNITAVGITINNTGADTFNGALAAGTGALSVTGDSSITDTASPLSGAGVTLSSSGAISVGSTITSTGIVALTSTGSTISVTGNIGAAGTTTFSSAGTTTLGNVLTSASFITLSASQANLNGNVTASAGAVSINAPAVIGTTSNVNGTTVTFGSTIAGAGSTLHITATNTNFNGNIGVTGSPLASLTVTATGGSPAIAFNSPASGVFANTQSYGANVTVATNFLFSGNSFIFSGSLNTTGSTSLTIAGTETGTLSIAGPTIGTTLLPFSSITITDVTAASITGSMVATNNISIDHATTHVPVTLTGSITSLAGTVSLPGNVILGVGANAITASPSAGVVGITLGNVTGAATGNLTLTSNGVGNVTGVTIAVGSIGSSGGRVGDIDFKSPAVTLLGGDIFAHAITFEDNIAGTPGIASASVPLVATVVYVGGGSHNSGLILNTSGAFTMEQNQKLTVYDATITNSANITSATGSVTIDSSAGGGLITVADISAMGKITLNAGALANAIHIINRPGAKAIQPNGTLTPVDDNGTDLVSAVRGSNVGFAITGTVTVVQPAGLSTANSFVTLASGNVQNDISNSVTLVVDPGTKALNLLRVSPQVNPIPAITVADFTLTAAPNTALDLVAQGQPQNIANVLGTVIPQDVATLTPERGQTISGALRDALNELGIYARDLRTDEIIAYLVGRALYDDVPYKLDPDPTDNKIATNRLPYSPVLPMVESYEKLFFKFEKGADGKMKKVPQDKAISNAIGLAWVAYSAALKDKATGDHFRTYLEANVKTNPKLAAALDDINQLRDLLVQIKNLGLTENEFNVAQSALLKRVRPANIKDADFLAAIMGPSSVTHGQTAMR